MVVGGESLSRDARRACLIQADILGRQDRIPCAKSRNIRAHNPPCTGMGSLTPGQSDARGAGLSGAGGTQHLCVPRWAFWGESAPKLLCALKKEVVVEGK